MDAREAADVVEITQVVNRYGHALDGKRYELLEQVFTPGARLDYELEGGAPGSYPEMVPVFEEFLTAFCYTQHLFSQPVIDLEGDGAHATCRLVATHVQQPKSGGRNAWTVYGFYEDDLVRTAQGWRIAARRFRGLHSEGRRLPPDQVERFEKLPW